MGQEAAVSVVASIHAVTAMVLAMVKKSFRNVPSTEFATPACSAVVDAVRFTSTNGLVLLQMTTILAAGLTGLAERLLGNLVAGAQAICCVVAK